MRNFVVAIDGPSGTGKSTTARILADKLKVLYIDSGAMYRAITYLVLKKKINPTDSSKIIELTKSADLKLEGENVYINGEDVTKQIRSLEVTNRVSAISKIREVREILVSKQREFANSQSVIMDGRDIGTVVFPNADFKFYFTCDIKTRAARRQQDFRDHGLKIPLDKIKLELKKRDDIDANRKESPLRKAKESIEVDTTNMIIEEQVDCLYKKIISQLDN
ncbi:MAG: (d)CMP kinase [Ignavibacteriaceae bacterium]|jgi:cytidylate kinase|nr:MAG: (d)CMP kinase [Chlorobiota bacterium]KXK06244.1 MAG: cytidylate kinase [Chlorobi bacterium OLB4]MBV6399244.1 Cytidylate kinase [Ignavibacteria bacterium]MCC6884917.1 (d)CMP kinase [Ignavibacteriales bacterium]MCE7953552.1 (d)CMP kinase [Chlorobi bacterium CHB7]MDL1887558.1 (d)CMP kinase [Ignavibacteria bacterium CHB1]MEB2329314.1 (d)CMP kinase [Ignavibacteriaceae bacterium]OQY78443.1 MAG: cytidylate kinase [Ignavibacteriales bacterium UTCHB1]RIK49260.1 MAG: (d)CMP kinase [Ignavibact